MFYKSRAEDYSDDKLSSYKNDMICLNDPNDMRLEGQYKHDDGSFLKFKLIRCLNETSDGRSCAGDEEIENFINDYVLLILYNRETFNSNRYQTEIIHK